MLPSQRNAGMAQAATSKSECTLGQRDISHDMGDSAALGRDLSVCSGQAGVEQGSAVDTTIDGTRSRGCNHFQPHTPSLAEPADHAHSSRDEISAIHVMIRLLNAWPLTVGNPSIPDILSEYTGRYYILDSISSSRHSTFDLLIASIATPFSTNRIVHDFLTDASVTLQTHNKDDASIDIRHTSRQTVVRDHQRAALIVYVVRLAKLVHPSAIGRFFSGDDWRFEFHAVAFPCPDECPAQLLLSKEALVQFATKDVAIIKYRCSCCGAIGFNKAGCGSTHNCTNNKCKPHI